MCHALLGQGRLTLEHVEHPTPERFAARSASLHRNQRRASCVEQADQLGAASSRHLQDERCGIVELAFAPLVDLLRSIGWISEAERLGDLRTRHPALEPDDMHIYGGFLEPLGDRRDGHLSLPFRGKGGALCPPLSDRDRRGRREPKTWR